MGTTAAQARALGRVVPACVGLLTVLTPFGREATLPGYFVAYRLLLLATGALCLWSVRRARGPDFPSGFYIRWLRHCF